MLNDITSSRLAVRAILFKIVLNINIILEEVKIHKLTRDPIHFVIKYVLRMTYFINT